MWSYSCCYVREPDPRAWDRAVYWISQGGVKEAQLDVSCLALCIVSRVRTTWPCRKGYPRILWGATAHVHRGDVSQAWGLSCGWHCGWHYISLKSQKFVILMWSLDPQFFWDNLNYFSHVCRCEGRLRLGLLFSVLFSSKDSHWYLDSHMIPGSLYWWSQSHFGSNGSFEKIDRINHCISGKKACHSNKICWVFALMFCKKSHQLRTGCQKSVL